MPCVDHSYDVAQPVSPLRVVEVDAQTDPRWEAFVTARPHGLIYHHPAWLQVLEDAFGCKPVTLACEDVNGQFWGVLPLCHTRGLVTGHRFSSLPRTVVAGPLVRDGRAMALLVRAAVERTADVRGAQLQLKMLSNSLDGLVNGLVGIPERTMYFMELPARPELLQMGTSHSHSQIKKGVNKASRRGIEVYPAETERELRAWYELYLDTTRRVATIPRPYHFLKIAWERLQPRGLIRLLLAKHYEAGRAKLVSGLLLLPSGQSVSNAFSGGLQEERSLHSNDALQWRAIQDACAEGYRCYNFGEVPKNNQGLAAFKSKWGAEPTWLYSYYYPGTRELEGRISAERNHAQRLMLAAWQWLPNKAVAHLSAWAYRYF